MTIEHTRLTVSISDRLFERDVDTDAELDCDTWGMSTPIPGAVIINSWEIYHRQKIILVATDTGRYQIYRTLDMKTFTKVHDHATEIYNIYYIDDGLAVFSATDGWWYTSDSGLTWTYLDAGVGARAAMVLNYDDLDWMIFAYGIDRKIYARHYPTGSWSEVYDVGAAWSGKWSPAIAGGSPGILVGAGPYLIRSEDLGVSWQTVQDFSPRIVKKVLSSTRSNTPVYMVEVDVDGKSEIWWTYDMGDSVTLDEIRFDVIEDAQAVIPTGQSSEVQKFVVFGRRTPESDYQHEIFEV